LKEFFIIVQIIPTFPLAVKSPPLETMIVSMPEVVAEPEPEIRSILAK
jgi:hypothetical protein